MKRSRLTLLALLLAWLFSLGVVYVLGLLTAFTFHQAPGGDDAHMPLPDRAYAVTVARYLDQPVDWQLLKSGDTSPAVPEQVQALVVTLDREPNAERRTLAAESIAGAFPGRRVVPAIQELLQEPVTASRNALITALFQRWGQIDGRSALDFCRSAIAQHPLAEQFLRAALNGWASERAENAWRWVSQNTTDPSVLAEHYAAVIAHGGRLDDALLQEWIGQLGDAAVAEEVGAIEAVRRLHADGARSAFAFAEAVTDDFESRIAVLSRVLTAWAEIDRASALRWSESLPEEDRGWTLTPIVEAWTGPFDQALQWIAEQPVSPERNRAMREASRHWLTAAGPAPLGEFLNNADTLAAYSAAIEMLALETMTVDPETAFSWATLIADPVRRQFTTSMVGAFWMNIAPDDATYALRELAAIDSPGLAIDPGAGAISAIPDETAETEPAETAPPPSPPDADEAETEPELAEPAANDTPADPDDLLF